MIGKSNSGIGGSLKTNAALLHIITFAGSEVTILKGEIVLKVISSEKGFIDLNDGRLSHYYYSIDPKAYGTITVNILSVDLKSKTKTVVVEENTIYDVYIYPDLVIVPNGLYLTWTRSNGPRAKNNNITATQTDESLILGGYGSTTTTGQGGSNRLTSSTFDLTHYSRMIMSINSYAYPTGNTQSVLQFGLSTTSYNWIAYIEHTSTQESGQRVKTINADISNVTGDCVLMVMMWAFNTNYNSNCGGTVTECRFEA